MYVYGACWFYFCCSDYVRMFWCGFFSLEVLRYVVCWCKGCDGCCVFCLYCDACSCRFSCMRRMSVSSCRSCILVSCVHPVAVLNAAFYTLGNIDPDTNFLSNINTSICNYHTELEFNQQFPQDYKLSMFNLIVRKLPKGVFLCLLTGELFIYVEMTLKLILNL